MFTEIVGTTRVNFGVYSGVIDGLTTTGSRGAAIGLWRAQLGWFYLGFLYRAAFLFGQAMGLLRGQYEMPTVVIQSILS